jgi:hypothetical protein
MWDHDNAPPADDSEKTRCIGAYENVSRTASEGAGRQHPQEVNAWKRATGGANRAGMNAGFPRGSGRKAAPQEVNTQWQQGRTALITEPTHISATKQARRP